MANLTITNLTDNHYLLTFPVGTYLEIPAQGSVLVTDSQWISSSSLRSGVNSLLAEESITTSGIPTGYELVDNQLVVEGSGTTSLTSVATLGLVPLETDGDPLRLDALDAPDTFHQQILGGGYGLRIWQGSLSDNVAGLNANLQLLAMVEQTSNLFEVYDEDGQLVVAVEPSGPLRLRGYGDQILDCRPGPSGTAGLVVDPDGSVFIDVPTASSLFVRDSNGDDALRVDADGSVHIKNGASVPGVIRSGIRPFQVEQVDLFASSLTAGAVVVRAWALLDNDTNWAGGGAPRLQLILDAVSGGGGGVDLATYDLNDGWPSGVGPGFNEFNAMPAEDPLPAGYNLPKSGSCTVDGKLTVNISAQSGSVIAPFAGNYEVFALVVPGG